MIGLVYTRNGRRYHLICDYGMPKGRKERLVNRRDYWMEILRQSEPGSGCHNLARRMIGHIKSEILAINAFERSCGDEKEPEDYMGAMGGPEYADVGAGN